MTEAHHPLAAAFDVAAGRAPSAPSTIVPAPLLRLARRVVAAGRRAEASPPCPRAVLARAESLFGTPRGVGQRLVAALRLLADSWAGTAAPARGAGGPRVLRYGGDGATLDLEIGSGPSGPSGPSGRGGGGGFEVRGLVETDRPSLSVRVTTRAGRAVRAPVGVAGTFSCDLRAGEEPGSVEVLSRGRPVYRTGSLPRARA